MTQTQLYKYGYSFDDIEKQISKPERQEKPWGYFCLAVNEEIYGMDQVVINQEKTASLDPKDYQGREVLFYLESGEIQTGDYNLVSEDTLFLPLGAFSDYSGIKAKKDSILYIFFGLPQKGLSYRLRTIRRY